MNELLCSTCGRGPTTSRLRFYKVARSDPKVFRDLAVGLQMASGSLYTMARKARQKTLVHVKRFGGRATETRSRDYQRSMDRAADLARQARAASFRLRWELSRCSECHRPRRLGVGKDGTGGLP